VRARAAAPVPRALVPHKRTLRKQLRARRLDWLLKKLYNVTTPRVQDKRIGLLWGTEAPRVIRGAPAGPAPSAVGALAAPADGAVVPAEDASPGSPAFNTRSAKKRDANSLPTAIEELNRVIKRARTAGMSDDTIAGHINAAALAIERAAKGKELLDAGASGSQPAGAPLVLSQPADAIPYNGIRRVLGYMDGAGARGVRLPPQKPEGLCRAAKQAPDKKRKTTTTAAEKEASKARLEAVRQWPSQMLRICHEKGVSPQVWPSV